MWKFRAEAIALLAIAFAVKSLAHPDAASVCGLVLFVGVHYIDRFFSGERAEKKLIRKIEEMHQELLVVKQEQQRLNLSVGIRGLK